jgi:hypothetical protein
MHAISTNPRQVTDLFAADLASFQRDSGRDDAILRGPIQQAFIPLLHLRRAGASVSAPILVPEVFCRPLVAMRVTWRVFQRSHVSTPVHFARV